MKIFFLVLSLVDCRFCPTELPSVYRSLKEAAMEAAKYENIKHADLFEYDVKTRTIKKIPLPKIEIKMSQ